jgi:hypothetical protein
VILTVGNHSTSTTKGWIFDGTKNLPKIALLTFPAVWRATTGISGSFAVLGLAALLLDTEHKIP